MRLRRFTKTPDEVKRYGINYTKWLDTSEQVYTITLQVTGGDGLLVANRASISPDAKEVVFFVSAGTAGKNYNVIVEISTTIGQVREDTIPFIVLAP